MATTNRSLPKSKLSLRRKAETTTENPVHQKLLTKQLVPPKLKLKWTSAERETRSKVGERNSDAFVSRSVPCSTGGDDHHSESEVTAGGHMKCVPGNSRANTKREGDYEEGDDGREMKQDLGCKEDVLDVEDESRRRPMEGGGEETGVGLGGHAQSTEEDKGLGDLFFCHVCQKDLTKFNLIRRQAHINRCCDENPAGQDAVQLHACVLCKKTFHNETVKNQHMKSCARSKGLTTAQLLDKVRQGNETSSEGPLPAKKQTTLRHVLGNGDNDFKQPPPPPRTRRRKKHTDQDLLASLGDVEYEQLQLALAMSASLAAGDEANNEHQELAATSEDNRSGLPGPRRRKRKRADPVHFPLLSASSQQCRDRIAHRAEQLLLPAGANEGTESKEIPCTPMFGNSELAMGVASTAQTNLHVPAVDDEDDNAILFASDEEDNFGRKICPDLNNHLDPSSIRLSSMISHSKLRSVGQHGGKDGGDGEGGGCSGAGEVGRSATEIYESGDGRINRERKCALWQLGTSDFTASGCKEFYVAALSTAISPMKTNPLYCRRCDSSMCGVGTLPPEVSPAASSESKPNSVLLRDGCGTGNTTAAHSSLLSDLRSMMNSSLLSDLTILTRAPVDQDAEDEMESGVRAHCCILAARCRGFRAVIECGDPCPDTLDLSEFHCSSVLKFLEYVYTGECHGNQAEELQEICVRMSSVEEVRKISRYSPKKFDKTVHAADDDGCREEKLVKSTDIDNGSTDKQWRLSRVLFSESPSPSVTESPKSEPLLSTHLYSPALPSPPSPILAISLSNSPITPTSELRSLRKGQEDVLSSPPQELPTTKPYEPLVAVNTSGMEDSFDIPTPTYVSSGSLSPSTTPVVEASAISQAGSSSSGDLVLCGVSHDRGMDCESDREEIKSRRWSMLGATSTNEAKDNENEKEAIAVEVIELPEDKRSEEEDCDGVDKENKDSKGRKTSFGDTATIELNEVPPLTAEDEDLFYVNDQFENDWLLDVTDYDIAFNSSSCSSCHKNITCSQPPLSSHSSRSTGARHSLSQAPPRNDSLSFVTPASVRASSIVSDDNITPMPQYHNMATPYLKKEGQKFGLKGLPKRKMITKLTEIYKYTHPLVAEDGTVVPEDIETGNMETLCARVKHAIISDLKFYQDILLYKPLDLGFIQNKLKSSGVVLAKDKLMDVLDSMCITYSDPRNSSGKKKEQAGLS